jgi:hypothetical protein
MLSIHLVVCYGRGLSLRSRTPPHPTQSPLLIKKLETASGPHDKSTVSYPFTVHTRGGGAVVFFLRLLSSPSFRLLSYSRHPSPPPPASTTTPRPPTTSPPLAAHQPLVPLNPALPNHSRWLPPPPTHPPRLRQRLRRRICRPRSCRRQIRLHRAPCSWFLTNPTLAANPGPTGFLHHLGGRRHRRPLFRPRSATTAGLAAAPRPPSRPVVMQDPPTPKPQTLTRTLRRLPPSTAARAGRCPTVGRPAHNPPELEKKHDFRCYFLMCFSLCSYLLLL